MKTYLLSDKRIFNLHDANDGVDLTNVVDAGATGGYAVRRAVEYEAPTNEISGFLGERKPCRLIVATFYYRLPGFVDLLTERIGCKVASTFEFFSSACEGDALHSLVEVCGDFGTTTVFCVENGMVNILTQSTDTKSSGKTTVVDFGLPASLKTGKFEYSMPVSKYELETIPSTERFDTEFDTRLLTEANGEISLSVKKIVGRETSAGRLTVPASSFELSSFRVGGLKLVELSLSCRKDYFNNLDFKVRSLDNEIFYVKVAFYRPASSLVRLLKKDFVLRHLAEANESATKDDSLSAAVDSLLNLVDSPERERLKQHVLANVGVLLALRKAGELKTIDDWSESENLSDDLKFFDRKLSETIEKRTDYSVCEVEKRKKETER